MKRRRCRACAPACNRGRRRSSRRRALNRRNLCTASARDHKHARGLNRNERRRQFFNGDGRSATPRRRRCAPALRSRRRRCAPARRPRCSGLLWHRRKAGHGPHANAAPVLLRDGNNMRPVLHGSGLSVTANEVNQ